MWKRSEGDAFGLPSLPSEKMPSASEEILTVESDMAFQSSHAFLERWTVDRGTLGTPTGSNRSALDQLSSTPPLHGWIDEKTPITKLLAIAVWQSKSNAHARILQ